MFAFGAVVIVAEFVQVSGFFGSYMIDIFGPAFVYIYIRGLYSKERRTRFWSFASPEIAAFGILAICSLVEMAQFFRLYNKHYDPYDFIAYASLLLPCYGLDRWLLSRQTVV